MASADVLPRGLTSFPSLTCYICHTSPQATAEGRQPVLQLPEELSAAEKLLRSCWAMDVAERLSMENVMEALPPILRGVVEGGMPES